MASGGMSPDTSGLDQAGWIKLDKFPSPCLFLLQASLAMGARFDLQLDMFSVGQCGDVVLVFSCRMERKLAARHAARPTSSV